MVSRPITRRQGHSQPDQLLGLPAASDSNVKYSKNWAGAVWTKDDKTFTTVTGTFTVPTPSGKDGAASAWVGIDGDTKGDAILQTGIDIKLSDGVASYDAWYEWLPDCNHKFSTDDITISAGDVIKLTVTASSETSGTAAIKNLTTGDEVSKDLTSSSALHERNAEWIVEDYKHKGELVPFVNFGTVTFTDATASGASDTGSNYSGADSGDEVWTPSGADIREIKQDDKVLTDVTTDASSVTITYTGDSSDSSSDS